MSPEKYSNNDINNNNKPKTLVTRHPALCFNIFFWLATLIYATAYFTLGSERFLRGSLSFFIGFTATARLFYLSPSLEGNIRPGELDALNPKVLARFPCSVVALVFTPAGVLLWLGHQHYVIDLWFFDPDQLLFSGAFKSAVFSTLVVLATAAIHGFVALGLTVAFAGRVGFSETARVGFVAFEVQFRRCVLYPGVWLGPSDTDEILQTESEKPKSGSTTP